MNEIDRIVVNALLERVTVSPTTARVVSDAVLDAIEQAGFRIVPKEPARQTMERAVREPERRSTHYVHRGADSTPCFCAARSDHTIGKEKPEPVITREIDEDDDNNGGF